MRSAWVWLLLATCAPALADPPPSITHEKSPAAPVAEPNPAPFLWEVQGPKAKHYLLGSVHMLPKDAQPLPLALDAAYAASRATVFESDIARLNSPELQSRMLGASKEDRAGGLKKRIGPPMWGRLQAHAKKLGMPVPICATFRAWFCALTLEMSAVQMAGFDAAYGIDQYFYAKAVDDGRPIAGLETPEQQLDLFIGMSDAQSAKFLGATLDGMTDSSMDPAELGRVWKSGDLASLEKEMNELKARYPDVYARLLTDRNRSWVPQLADKFNGEVPQFVVVGAAHLPGPEGLLTALRAQGFSTVAVTAPPVVPEPAAAPAPVATRDPRPEGVPYLIPQLRVHEVEAASEFYQKAFGFEPAEGAHALRYRDVRFALIGENAKDAKSTPVTTWVLYVDDVDATAARAKIAGAEILEAPADHGADRSALLRDPEGYVWRCVTHRGGAEGARPAP